MLKKRTDKSLSARGSWLARLLNIRCANCGFPTARVLVLSCPHCGYPWRSRVRCPSCGQKTARTQDWACQWCGHPLLADLYTVLPGNRAEADTPPSTAVEAPPAIPIGEAKAEEPVAPPATEAVVESPPAPPAEITPEPPPAEPAPAVEAAPVPPPAEPVPPAEPPPTPEPVAETKIEIAPEATPAPEPAVAEVPPPLLLEEVTATLEALHAAFQADRTAADTDYRGKMLKIKGVVEQVSVPAGAEPAYLVLASADPSVPCRAYCSFESRYIPLLKRMETGHKVTVTGRYAGYDGNVHLVDCLPVG